MKLNEIVKNIRQWSVDRGLDKKTDRQVIKLQEEVGELATAYNKKRPEDFQDALGDIFVVITILAQQNGINIEDAIGSAYDIIKDRKGKKVDGVFIKEGD